MTNYRNVALAAVVSFGFVAPAAAEIATSPISPSYEQNATTVYDTAPRSGAVNARSTGISPSAPSQIQNATTVQRANMQRSSSDAPAIGVSPSAPSYMQDASTAQVTRGVSVGTTTSGF
ncbi:hypothetical protein [Aureimonas populi]|uniref:Uncharacterized protein n=1 Tax=Aureimonas populi TaxID=1701758 RepID=A0ABW5CJ24_9HYPH|nr:hypothetical protein [Aureimonas populi]